MAKQLRVIKASTRAEKGKGPARRLRAAGRVPAVIYAKGKEARPLTLERGEMERAVNRNERLISLDIEGKVSQALVKEVQFEPVSRLIAHVDFQEISATEAITVTVQIRPRGTPEGAKEGGVLDVVMHEVEVEGRSADIPDEIRVDVTALQIGDVIRAGELTLPPGLKLVTDGRSTVVALEHPRSEEDAEAQVAEAGAGEPEVLTGKKEEGEAAAEAAPPAAEEKKPEDAG
ncbi:MAG: 50S ribosomal protein L25 [Planctomycetota bacterium]|jgi:large subunit ribosomal protein L25